MGGEWAVTLDFAEIESENKMSWGLVVERLTLEV